MRPAPLLLSLVAGSMVGLSYLALSGYVFVVALALLCVVVTGLVKPEYTFYLMLFVLVEEMVHIFITYSPIYEIRIYLFVVPLFATALGFAMYKATHEVRLVRTPIDAPLLVVLCYGAVSLLWAPNFTVGLWLMVSLLANYLLFFVIKNLIRNDIILKRSVRVLIAVGIVAAVSITLSQWVTLEKILYFTQSSGIKMAFEEQVSRPAGLAGVDHVAGFVSIAFFMNISMLLWEKRRKVRYGYFALGLLMLIGIVLTTSRGVLIGLLVAFVYFLLMHGRFKGRFLRSLAIFFSILIFVVLVAKPGFIDRMLIGFGYTGTLLFSEASYSGTEANTAAGEGLSGMEIRWIWWNNSLQEMGRTPLKLIFGQGLGGFYYYSAAGVTVSSPETNGIVFAFFYEMGLFGTVLFALLVVIIVKYAYGCFRNAEKDFVYHMAVGATAALIAETGIHGLIDYDLVSYGSKYFWFPLAFAMAALSMVKPAPAPPAATIEASGA